MNNCICSHDEASHVYLEKGRNQCAYCPCVGFIDTSKWQPSAANAEPEPKPDAINPKHYTSDPSGVECIQIVRHRSFNIGAAMKYLWRAGLKGEGTTVQDLQKAIWHITDEIGKLSGQGEHAGQIDMKQSLAQEGLINV